MKTIKQVFDHHFQHVEFDADLAQRILTFVQGFIAKNNDHVTFFGGNLLGVEVVRWHFTDSDFWWDELFDVVPENVHRDLLRTPEVKGHRVVSSDVLNHAMIYTIHRLHHAKIPDDLKQKAKVYTMVALNCKFLCSLMAHYFKHPADKGIAEKAFNCLSNRFDLKTTGSWGKMLAQRSTDFLQPGARYFDAYVNYTNDIEIVKMINDAQGRIRETFKAVTFEYYKQLNLKAKVLLSSSQVELDGVVVLKDVQRKLNVYNRYIKTVISNVDSFIKEPLNEVVYNAVPSINQAMYENLLTAFSTHYHDRKYTKTFDNLIDNLLTFSFELMRKNDIAENNLPGLLYRLKHVYMSGRVADQALLDARKDFEKVVEVTDKRLRNTPLVPERCGFFLYLILRTVTMNYYKN